MVTRIVSLVTAHPWLTVLVALVLAGVGFDSYRKLPIDAVPDVSNVQVQVLTTAPGLSPVEVERLVTQPVELALTGIPGVNNLRSVSRAAISAVTVVFDDDVDIHFARQLVAQNLDKARAAIPESAGRPQLGPLTTSLGEVYQFTIAWPGHSLGEVRAVLEWDVAYRLRSVPGVVEVNPWGGDERQIEVRMRDADLAARGVSATMVAEAVLGSGMNVSAGSIERGEEGTFVRAEAIYATTLDVASQVVEPPRAGDTPVLVEHVAEVVDGKAPRFAAATADGKGETVYAMVQMIAGGNAHQVVGEVKKRLAEIEKSLPEGVVIETIYDRASFVDRVLSTVRKNLLEGGIIVALVLLLMLGNLKAGLIVASVIPLSMLGAFALMRLAGVTGNLLSLGAIDFGLVVDGAVVVVEGALAAMAAHRLTGRQASSRVASEVGRPVVMAVAIIGIVYAPVLLLEGVEGKMFRPMAITVLFAMAVALVLTFTLVPALVSLTLTDAHDEEPRIVAWLRRAYEPVLRFVLGRHLLVGGALAAMLLVGVIVGARLGAEFMPRLEEEDLAVQINRPPSVSLAESVAGTTDVEAALLQFPDVKRVVTRTGSPDVATDVMGIEQSDVFVLLKPRDEWVTGHDAASFSQAFEPVLKKALPGAAFGFTQPIEMRVQELLGGVKADVGVKIYGDDLGKLHQSAQRVVAAIERVRGAADVRSEPLTGLRSITIRPNPLRMGQLGVPTEEVLVFTQALRLGQPVGEMVEGQRRFGVVLRFDEEPAPDPEALGALLVPLRDGRQVTLRDVADITLGEGPAQVSREQARRRVTVEANVRDRDLASFVTELQQHLEEVELPSGYYYEIGGEYQNLARASRRLLVVVPITLAAIALLLFFAFGDARPAMLIFLNVPAAATGGVLALASRGLDLSISAAVGFLALFGVATLNGVVLLAAARHRQREGATREQAAREAASERLRPVLTTATVAALGFMPMALATGTGAEVQRPLATVVVGGLVTATLVTLLALPTLYARFGGDVQS
ncbi:MAG: efflux RND transporter permease subunit [Myxococcales bacterium]|nr:efflux RND transporter permease subunit [Myxococcales bacterium]